MNTPDGRCDVIQPIIATRQTLTPEQLAHIAACAECSAVQHEFAQLDLAVEQAMIQAVPETFADHVMAQLPTTPRHAGENLQTLFARSRLLQVIGLSLGIAVGASHIVRFLLGAFIAGMAAAS